MNDMISTSVCFYSGTQDIACAPVWAAALVPAAMLIAAAAFWLWKRAPTMPVLARPAPLMPEDSAWRMVDRGLYESAFGNVIREHDGWFVFRKGKPGKGPFVTMHSARRWAENNPPRESTR